MNDPRTRCATMKARALEMNPRVSKLLGSLKELGCDPGPLEDFIQCTSRLEAGKDLTGGFSTSTSAEDGVRPRVLMIEEHLPYQSIFDATLVHELVHAYDQCRGKIDWGNRYHLACSEVRASNLSGECGFIHEVNRGKFGILKHHQTCVRRRAALSVALAYGTSPADAEPAVNAVYNRCYADPAPFQASSRGHSN